MGLKLHSVTIGKFMPFSLIRKETCKELVDNLPQNSTRSAKGENSSRSSMKNRGNIIASEAIVRNNGSGGPQKGTNLWDNGAAHVHGEQCRYLIDEQHSGHEDHEDPEMCGESLALIDPFRTVHRCRLCNDSHSPCSPSTIRRWAPEKVSGSVSKVRYCTADWLSLRSP